MSSLHHKRALRISVNLAAIQNNLALAKKRAAGQKLLAVVKADAYGHGAVKVATALDQADGFAVVTLAEAVELREASIAKPILVLQGACTQAECEAFAQYQLWPVVHCMDQLRWFGELPQAQQLSAWIKIDTGMGRLGFQPHEFQKILASDYGLNWFGAMTHFASADEPENQLTKQQIDSFFTLTQHLNVQKSLANSAALLAWPESKGDWARPGIMLYGSNPIQSQSSTEVTLQLAMRVSAPLISIKQYKAGDAIGYASGYICPGPMSVGYIGIGYGDGMPRLLDEGASVLVNGQVCPIIGRVSMDSIAVDLSHAARAQLGDNAVLWGDEHPIELLANAARTISHELMISIRGPREYI